jgi:7-cyano-7-deazaguanine synthase
MKKAVAIVSGGLDSVTLAYLLHNQGFDLHLLSFDYGQKHKKELEFAKLCAQDLGAKHSIVDLTSITKLISNSSLTSEEIEVPHGHYAAPNMALTVVPNRNAIMLTIAFGAAVNEEAQAVAIGVHGGDHFIYPDCRPGFVESFAAMQKHAVEGYGDPNLELLAPFIHIDKTGIVREGARLNVPFEKTWSCYEGTNLHCGKCGTCVERKESFELAGVVDPTEYVD